MSAVPTPSHLATQVAVLLVANRSQAADAIGEALGDGFHVSGARGAAELNQRLAEAPPGLVIVDWSVGEGSPLELIARLQARAPATPCIVVADAISVEEAVAVMQAGARDCVQATDLSRLRAAAWRELASVRTQTSFVRRAQELAETNDRLIEEQRERARITEILHGAALAANGAFEIGALVNLLSHTARALFGDAVDGVICLAEEDGSLAVLASDGSGRVQRAFESSTSTGVAAVTYRELGPVIVNDYATSPHAIESIVKNGLKSVMGVPLLVQNRPIGVLDFFAMTPHTFTSRDAEVAGLLAAQLAPAVEAARVHETLRRREAKQALVAAIGRAAVAGADDDDLTELALPDLAALLQADAAAILAPSKGGLAVRQARGWLQGVKQPISADPAMRIPGTALQLPDLNALATATGAACVSVSIVHRGEPAVLSVCRPQRLAFSLIELHFLGAVGSILTEASRARSAELERRSSERRYRGLVESVVEGIWHVDPDGQTLYTNKAMAQLLRCDHAELARRSLHEFPATPQAVRAYERLIAGCLRGRSGRAEIRLRAEDGTELDTILAASPVRDGEGNVVSVLALISDLSDRREAERARGESEAKSRFLAAMSHELRTPLNSILGFAQLLQDERFGALSERQARYLEHILSQGQHLRELIADVLDLSKVSTGRMEFNQEPVDLAGVARSVAGRMQPLAAARGQELRVEAPEGVIALADPLRVTQCLLNLVSNAVKFAPADQPIVIRAGKQGCETVLAVVDQGPGIAEEDQESLFEEFTKLSRGMRGDGTGLGLALTRRLVEGMGGRISVESMLSGGSTFTLYIPAAPSS